MFVPIVHNCAFGSAVVQHLLGIYIQLLNTSSVVPFWLEAQAEKGTAVCKRPHNHTVPAEDSGLQHSPREGRCLVCLQLGKNHNRCMYSFSRTKEREGKYVSFHELMLDVAD